jgi:hypothetical protein
MMQLHIRNRSFDFAFGEIIRVKQISDSNDVKEEPDRPGRLRQIRRQVAEFEVHAANGAADCRGASMH